ncbi:glycerol-3-phosphate dehydrogenase/oxidase [Ferruginibacter sp.]|nr:glycerol-3-phosphate dehydrogenase/oxidase [Ferruginibacter sp.]
MNRQIFLTELEKQAEWDVVIIGGGATGLGCAVDAASRGYKTLLLEQYDFAKGTSSKATKLVHGGVRYLAQGNIKLVTEALKERGILLRNAPHVCHTQNFIIANYSWWSKIYYGIGLKLYDLMAAKLSLGSTKIVSAGYVLQHLPCVKKQGLKGGVVYTDGQFDDARLAVNLAQTACAQGATVINYCRVAEFIFTEGKITGVVAEDVLHKKQYHLKTKAVINATGVFAAMLMKAANDNSASIAPSQGVHIVVDKKHFDGIDALMIPKTTDGRVLFAVPWHNKVIVGTTDTAVNNTTIEPTATGEEVDFIINNFNSYAAVPITKNDVLSVFTGLRPLIKKEGVKGTAALNRHHAVFVSPSALITVTGGKWTTYRKMAEDAVDKAAEQLHNKKKSVTITLKIHGYTIENDISYLSVYGSDAAVIEKLWQGDERLKEKIHPAYPYTKAEVIFAVRNEMAQTLEDVLARRIRLLFLDATAAIASASITAMLMAQEMNKDEQWVQQQVTDFTQLAKQYLLS